MERTLIVVLLITTVSCQWVIQNSTHVVYNTTWMNPNFQQPNYGRWNYTVPQRPSYYPVNNTGWNNKGPFYNNRNFTDANRKGNHLIVGVVGPSDILLYKEVS